MQFIDSMSCLFSLSIAVYTLSDCIKRSYAYLAFTTCQALFWAHHTDLLIKRSHQLSEVEADRIPLLQVRKQMQRSPVW